MAWCRHTSYFPDLFNPQNRPRGQSPPQLPLLDSSNTMRGLSLLLAILAMASATVQVRKAGTGAENISWGGLFEMMASQPRGPRASSRSHGARSSWARINLFLM